MQLQDVQYKKRLATWHVHRALLLSKFHSATNRQEPAGRLDVLTSAPSAHRRSFSAVLFYILFYFSVFFFFRLFTLRRPSGAALSRRAHLALAAISTVQIATRAKCNKNIKLNLKKYVKLKKNTYQSRISQLPARNLKAHFQ